MSMWPFEGDPIVSRVKVLNVIPTVRAIHTYALLDPDCPACEAEEVTFLTLVDAFTDAMLGPGMSQRAMPPVGIN